MIPIIATGILVAGIVSSNITGAEAANWNVFNAVHVFDPNAPGNNNWSSWSAADWISWLYAQEPRRRQANNGYGQPLQDKRLHTVILANENDVVNAFSGDTPPYRNNCVWSNRMFPTIMFENQNGASRVFRTPNVFIAAALDGNNRPLHLDAIFDSRPTGGNANFPFAQRGTQIN